MPCWQYESWAVLLRHLAVLLLQTLNPTLRTSAPVCAIPRWFNPLLNQFRGGGNITGTVQQDPHFIVWMRLAPLPTLRKLWAVMPTQNLIAGDQLQLTVSNRYNSFAFDGKKSIVLSTTTWLGTYNPFLGSVFLAVGGAAVAAAFAYVITATWIKPRRLGDLSVLPASEWSSAH